MPYATFPSYRTSSRTASAALAPLCALVLLTPWAAQEIAFAPEDETELRKSFETRISLELSDFGVTLNDADPGQLEGTVRVSSTERVEVVDLYAGSQDGRPTRVDRQFEQISLESDFEQIVSEEGAVGQGTASAESELAESTVRFEWEDGEWTKSFVDQVQDEGLLPGLSEDMDLRCLLPDGEVEEGDSWSVEPGLFLRLLIPAGDLALEYDFERPEGDPRFQFIGLDAQTGISLRPYLQGFEGEAGGSVTANFDGSSESEGRSLARLLIEFDLDLDHDSSELLIARWKESPMYDGISLDMDSASTRIELSGEAELLWDLAAGHASGFELEGDLNVTLDAEFNALVDAAEMDVVSTVELSGEIQQSVEFE